MPSEARLLLRQAERNGWYMVIDTNLTVRSAIAAWKVVRAASDDVHIVFFDHNRRLGSVLLSAGEARLLGYTQHGVIATLADRIIEAMHSRMPNPTADCLRIRAR